MDLPHGRHLCRWDAASRCHLRHPQLSPCPQRRDLFSCEDIGRHNALDKVIGYALRHQIDLTECMVYSSGRIPTDMAMKAIYAGIPVLSSKASRYTRGDRTCQSLSPDPRLCRQKRPDESLQSGLIFLICAETATGCFCSKRNILPHPHSYKYYLKILP